MTQNELNAHIKATFKDLLDKELGELVRESVATALKAARPNQPDYVSRLLDDGSGEPRKSSITGEEPGLAMARFVRAMAAAKISGGGGPEKALQILKGWGYDNLAAQWDVARQKALGTGDPTGGGFLVPTQFSTDLIELLRPSAVVRSLNPLTMPMPNGSVKVPKIVTGSVASYIGENTNIGKTQQEFGQIALSFKKLAALVPISNDLVRYSSPSADTIVRDDMVRAMATREDKAFIRDDGTSGTPKGLKYWVNPINKFNANATVNLANVTTDLGKMIQKLMQADVPIIVAQFPAGGPNQIQPITARPGWLMSPRTYMYLTTVQNSQGFYAFRPEMMTGTLWGFPYRVTSQILETNLLSGGQYVDTGGSAAELYFGAFAHAVIGEAVQIMVDASTEAAYNDGTGLQAAFSLDQTVVRVLAEHDFALRYDKAFSVLQGMTWGM